MCLISIQVTAQVKTIDYYINAALANSPTLKDYAIQLQQNSIDSMITGTAYKPQVNTSGVAYYAPTYGQFGYDPAISNGGEYAALISVTQQVLPHKQITLNRTLSASERESIASHARIEENDLKKEVTAKYLNTCLLQEQVKFYIQNDSFLIKQDAIIKELTGKGSYKVSDYYQLLVEERSENTQISQFYINLTQSFSELNVLCGIKDTVQYQLTIPQIEPFRQTDFTQLALYKKFAADSASLIQKDQLIETDYNPKLSWYADAGIEASQPNLIYKSIGNSVGLNLLIPIYDGNKRSLRHQSLKLSQASLTNYQVFFKTNYNTHIVLLAKQIEDENTLIQQLIEEQKQVQTWIKVTREELSAGNISVTDFLISLKKNLEVKNDLNQAIINKQLLQNEFNYWNH